MISYTVDHIPPLSHHHHHHHHHHHQLLLISIQRFYTEIPINRKALNDNNSCHHLPLTPISEKV